MMVALDAAASCTSFSVMSPMPRRTKLNFTSSRSKPLQRIGHRFQRALHVGLQHDVQRGRLAAVKICSKRSSSIYRLLKGGHL